MRIRELMIGLHRPEGATAMRIEPKPSGLSVCPVEDIPATPGDLARLVRSVLSTPERALGEEIPFVRLVMESGGDEIVVADDASHGARFLAVTRAGEALPPIEAPTRAPEDAEAARAEMDRLLEQLAALFGAGAELLNAGLAIIERPSEARDATPEEIAYVEAHRRLGELVRAVRAIDDRMTASVVPDWLWFATGAGGVGVFLTVIALLYPELRVHLVMTLVALSVVGFAAYGYRAFGEMKTRGRLQEERGAIRARREDAKKEVARLASGLASKGVSPEEVLARLGGLPADERLPAIIGQGALDPGEAERLEASGRQVVAFVARDGAEGISPHCVRPLEVVVPPGESGGQGPRK